MPRLFAIAALCLSLAATARAANPALRAADPHAVVLEKQMWVYATGGGRHNEFFAWSSKDLVTWKTHGPILRLGDVRWVPDDGARTHHAWAPCAIASGGKIYFYYSVGPQNPTPSRIGVAVADSPAGPFVDSGKPLVTGGNGFEAIDPFVLHDPKTGKHFLYAGGSAGAKLRIWELGDDMVSIQREVPVKTPEKFTEGPFVHIHGGRYFLSYSHGNYRNDTYSVHYATSDTATGPWEYKGAILTSDNKHKGPGHHSFVQLPGTGQWLVFYHRWNDRKGPGPYRGGRDTCIERFEHAAGGRIRPIVMTDIGVELKARR